MAERRLPLKGTPNFRDLGGYATHDGRVTRWGVLYRSGSLAALTPEDVDHLEGIGLRLVCDLRTDDERARAPSRLPDQPAPQVVHLSISTGRDGQAAGPSSMLISAESGEQVLQGILASYGRIALNNLAQYRSMFERILTPGRLPAMIHCTAGKDRTGIGSALVLLALGVPREIVLEDYALTRVYLTQEWRDGIMRMLVDEPARINRAVAEVMFDANPAYLEAALDAIERQYGDFDVFLRDGLGVGEPERRRLRDLLLE